MTTQIATRFLVSTLSVVPLFLLMSSGALAQDDSGPYVDQPLFATHEVLEVRIAAPLTTLLRDRPDEEYLDGKFYYTGADGADIELDLKLRTRGKYRARKSTCNFPPIRLNFKKGQVKDTEFAGQDKLKLVTHCQTRRDSFEQLVLREYLAYRLYQALTDKSFGARLMRVTYIDTEGGEETIARYGFVIEDADNMGDRIGLEHVHIPSIKAEELDAAQANLAAVFLYMIGNTDFSMILGPRNDDCCHNAQLYKAAGEPYTPIPYDFDFSGIVDAPYAEPNPRFKLRSVKTRLYRGRCMNNELLAGTFAYFIEKEAELYALVESQVGLDSKDRREVERYLDGFFEDIKSDKWIQRKFINRCI